MIKNYYYQFAEKEAKSIEEVDCLIEEYKNIKKINISTSTALLISFGSIFILAITNMFNLQASIVTSFIATFPKMGEELIGNNNLNAVTDISSIYETILDFLVYLVIGILAFTLYAMLYNRFNQLRLSAFYHYKRELIRQNQQSSVD